MKAIVTGISGQDGYFMARLLLNKGIEVVGLSRDPDAHTLEFSGPEFAGLILEPFDYAASGAFDRTFKYHQPELVFNFAAKATGQGMFDAPAEMTRLNATFVLDILEAIRHSPNRERTAFCQASSSEMFGNVTESPQNELTPFRPKSPYGAAKLYAHQMIGIYRSAFGVRCCSAILYNHESVRRSAQFVTRKIANGVARVKLGLDDHLQLGALDMSRDWGYAPEYVRAMYAMATAPHAEDYVVATGRLNSVRRLCEIVFSHVGLDYTDYVRVNSTAARINHSTDLHGDPSRIARELGWRAERRIEEIMTEMVDYEMALFRGQTVLR
jgi:GDPmannose 4,6-dehydratase